MPHNASRVVVLSRLINLNGKTRRQAYCERGKNQKRQLCYSHGFTDREVSNIISSLQEVADRLFIPIDASHSALQALV